MSHHRLRRVLAWTTGVVLVIAALAGGALAWAARRYRPMGDREDPRAIAAEVSRLRAERDSLALALRAQIDADPVLGTRPPGDVLIGLPTSLVRGVARDVTAQWFHDVDLTLRRIRVAKRGDVRAPMKFLGKRRVGTYDLALTIDLTTDGWRNVDRRLGRLEKIVERLSREEYFEGRRPAAGAEIHRLDDARRHGA